MAYKVIDEKLHLYSCGIADLTMQQVNSFLLQWEPDAPISSLTVFADNKNKKIVLNHDHRDFEDYKAICYAYMKSDDMQRMEMHKNLESAPAKEALNVLDSFHVTLRNERELFLIKHQSEPEEDYDMTVSLARAIVREYREIPYAMVLRAFRYGVMQGKRIERARRKAGEKV